MKQVDIFRNEVDPPEKYIGRQTYKLVQEFRGIINVTRTRTSYKCELCVVSKSKATDIRLRDAAQR